MNMKWFYIALMALTSSAFGADRADDAFMHEVLSNRGPTDPTPDCLKTLRFKFENNGCQAYQGFGFVDANSIGALIQNLSDNFSKDSRIDSSMGLFLPGPAEISLKSKKVQADLAKGTQRAIDRISDKIVFPAKHGTKGPLTADEINRWNKTGNVSLSDIDVNNTHEAQALRAKLNETKKYITDNRPVLEDLASQLRVKIVVLLGQGLKDMSQASGPAEICKIKNALVDSLSKEVNEARLVHGSIVEKIDKDLNEAAGLYIKARLAYTGSESPGAVPAAAPTTVSH